ncbi:MAG: hypothetical protein BWY74_03992 [Firmicutes bacterium ADurb.Bin419]|nr:MAG: hypothetical protein BWY74_03992 [Firmicutes bacterium ADurb.Bin419]
MLVARIVITIVAHRQVVDMILICVEIKDKCFYRFYRLLLSKGGESNEIRCEACKQV